MTVLASNTDIYIYVGIAVFVVLVVVLISLLAVHSKKTAAARLEKEKQARIAAGKTGEDSVEDALGCEATGERHIFRDYIVDVGPGVTAETDFICVTRGGVFVIEVKNWAGTVMTFAEEDRDWIQKTNGKRTSHHSPLRQNAVHAEAVRDLVPRKIPVTALLVFCNPNVKLKGSGKALVLTPRSLQERIDNAKDLISPTTVESVSSLLFEFRSQVTPEEHVKNVESLHGGDNKKKKR
ncbi:MAG: NERD domain-containing protein [Clostridia bacterium]|nr:NERD domain-containing protein [Clostridia bacterium]